MSGLEEDLTACVRAAWRNVDRSLGALPHVFGEEARFVGDDQREARVGSPTYGPVGRREATLPELTVRDLETVLGVVKRAGESKLRFEGALIAGNLRVHVRWKSGVDQRDGDELVVTKITRA